jgi:peptidoglycan/xylan/chitin deacetylase (PgdA/CDA1 family)
MELSYAITGNADRTREMSRLTLIRRLLLVALLRFAAPLHAQQVAITFDDLPLHGDLPPGETRLQVAQSILATIRHEHLPPVYGFINAADLQDEPTLIDVLTAWRAAGQPMGNHTYSHIGLNKLSVAAFERDIEKNEPTLSSVAAGSDWRWLRYPYLWEGDTLDKRHAVRSYLFAHGYRIAHVSMNFDDYLWNDPYARCSAQHNQTAITSLEKSYLAGAERGIEIARQTSQTLSHRDIPYVLLLHIGAFDARMFPALIQLFRDRGFTFVSLPQAQQDAAYSHDPDQPLLHGGTLQQQEFAARKLTYPSLNSPTRQLDALCPAK